VKGVFAKVLYDAFREKKTTRYVFFGPDRSGVVIVDLRNGRIERVESTWGGGRKELTKVFIWGSGEYTERPLDEEAMPQELQQLELTLEDVPRELLEAQAELLDVNGLQQEAVALEVIEEIRSHPRFHDLTRMEQLERVLEQLPTDVVFQHPEERWRTSHEIFRDLRMEKQTGVVVAERAHNGRYLGLVVEGRILGGLFVHSEHPDQVMESRDALAEIRARTPVHPFAWKLLAFHNNHHEALIPFFTGQLILKGRLPLRTFLTWVDEVTEQPGEFQFALVMDPERERSETVLLQLNHHLEPYHRGRALSLERFRKGYARSRTLCVWAYGYA